MKQIIILFTICATFSVSILNAKTTIINNNIIKANLIETLDTLPKVFVLGDNEKEFDKLLEEHETLLFTISNNNADLAFDRWLRLLVAMEDYSEQTKFDLKGVKMWLQVFWERDGAVRNIAYHLKPNSRNIEVKVLSSFLTEFCKHYRMVGVNTSKRFSHYGHANFPLLGQQQTSNNPH